MKTHRTLQNADFVPGRKSVSAAADAPEAPQQPKHVYEQRCRSWDIEHGKSAHSPLPAKHDPFGEPQWFGAYDAEGKLRATFDSPSEAYHYIRNRGHMYGGTDKPLVRSVNGYDKAIQALKLCTRELQGMHSYHHPTCDGGCPFDEANQAARIALDEYEKENR